MADDLTACQETLPHQPANSSEPQLPISKHLPADFRLQLQLLECIAQQGRVLQRLERRQEEAGSQLASLRAICGRLEEQLAIHPPPGAGMALGIDPPEAERRLTAQLERIKQELEEGQKQIGVRLEKVLAAEEEQACLLRPLRAPRSLSKAAPSGELAQCPFSKGNSNGNGLGAITTEDVEVCLSDDPCGAEARDSDCGPPQAPQNGCQHLVSSPLFDFICGLVISINVAVISYQGESSIRWAVEHVGEGMLEPPLLMVRLNYFFVAFYAAEMLVKLYAFGFCGFFCRREDYTWNIFDALLVVLALYELLAEVQSSWSGNTDQTWLRGLRLLKMLKMLRVVRVMRYFRELRIIVASIVGSLMTLFWSIIAIGVMIYVFCLCFLQGISEFLTETPVDKVPQDILEAIRTHWSSVYSALVTLYMAISGGSDWEPLANPVRAAGTLYFLLFLFFVALSTVAVLNVVTGMFVDAAMNVAVQDTHSVLEEVINRKEVKELRKYLYKRSGGSGRLDQQILDDVLENKHPSMRKFFKITAMHPDHVLKVFEELQAGGTLDIEEFIVNCLRFHGEAKGIDTLAIGAQIRRFTEQFVVVMEYLEEEFGHVQSSFEDLGLPAPAVKPLRERLQTAKCMPHQWEKQALSRQFSAFSSQSLPSTR